MTWLENFCHYQSKERWTLAELSRQTEISPETLQNWFGRSPNRGEPSISEAILLAETMGMSLDQLFLGVMPDDRLEAILRQALFQVRGAIQDGSAG